MTARQWWMVVLFGGVAVALSGTATAEWPKHRARPRPLPGIPCYPYQSTDVQPRPTVTVVSLVRVTAVPSATPAAAGILPPLPPVVPDSPVPGPLLSVARPGPQVYQLNRTRLQIDHCFLSRVAVTLHPDGMYQISLRADQNPEPGNDIRSPLLPGERVETTRQTSHLRRNLFIVKVRGYGVFPTLGERPSLAPGQPVLVELPVHQFWVQRGEPASMLFEGRSESVARFHELIDRVEVEFTYR